MEKDRQKYNLAMTNRLRMTHPVESRKYLQWALENWRRTRLLEKKLQLFKGDVD